MKAIQTKIEYFFMMILVIIWGITITSCTDEPMVTLDPSATVSTPAVSETELVLEKENEGTDVLNVNWTTSDVGYSASLFYIISFDKAGGDFSEPITVDNGGNLSKTFKSEELNNILLNLKLEPKVASAIDIRIEAKVGTYKRLISEVTSIEVTPYEAFFELGTTWGIVGSGYNNWGTWYPDAPFFKTKTPGVLVAYVMLLDGEIKFRENNDWNNNFGDDNNDLTLESGGANIPVTAGTYKIVFNTQTSTYTIEEFFWGVSGSAYNNANDFKFTYDDATNQWHAMVKLSDGEFVIRKNNESELVYGDTGNDGDLEQDGAGIPVVAGKYEITFNEEDLTVRIKEIPEIWSLVGGYNGWGGSFPDVQFDRDWRQENIWIIKNIYLPAGEIKFRENFDWVKNYGDNGADGTLEQDGANIVLPEGGYTIIMDLSDPGNPQWHTN